VQESRLKKHFGTEVP